MSDKKTSAKKVASAYMDKTAFNRFNAPEVLGALFAALNKAGLQDTVNTLKQKGVPKLINEAWMKKRKKG